jgi:hypothetical protein
VSTFGETILSAMWPFSQTATVEVEVSPRQSAEDRKEKIDQECKEAEEKFNADWRALQAYDSTHQQPFRFRAGDTLYIQSRVDDLERQQLERNLRKSTERRNTALRTRAELLQALGLIH